MSSPVASIPVKQRVEDIAAASLGNQINPAALRNLFNGLDALIRGKEYSVADVSNAARSVFETRGLLSQDGSEAGMVDTLLKAFQSNNEKAKQVNLSSSLAKSPKMFIAAADIVKVSYGSEPSSFSKNEQAQIISEALAKASEASMGASQGEAKSVFNKILSEALSENRTKLSKDVVTEIADELSTYGNKLSDIALTKGYKPGADFIESLQKPNEATKPSQVIRDALQAFSESEDKEAASMKLETAIAKMNPDDQAYFRSVLEERKEMSSINSLDGLLKLGMKLLPSLLVSGAAGKLLMNNSFVGIIMGGLLTFVGSLEDSSADNVIELRTKAKPPARVELGLEATAA